MMKRKIKSIGIVLALVLCVGVTACSNSVQRETEHPAAAAAEVEEAE